MNSAKIEICGAGFRYFAHVGRGLLGQSGTLIRELIGAERAAIITDSNIPPSLLEAVSATLNSSRFQVKTIAVAAGENAKSLREVERICDELSAFDRTSVIVGVGGGVVGDLSGFLAAILRRGLPHVQIPTTLLAMVDSSIGGKTGVNLAAGKNLVGAIHHPSVVIADTDVLKTLPARELRQGYAEIVKHAIICDAEMFACLSSRPERSEVEGSRGSQFEPGALGFLDFARHDELIARNIRIKAAIVSADACDVTGARARLNFGHTVGHAIECASDFGIPHGDCVSLGIIAACIISVKRAGFPPHERDKVIALLEQLGLPTRLPAGIAREKILAATARDKKFESGEVRFVVTPRIGQAYLSREVTMDDIGEAIAAI